MKFASTLAVVTGLITSVAAHGPLLGRDEVLRRADMSKRCEGAVAHFNKKRMAKRTEERQEDVSTPYYSSIQNQTCILTPEVIMGPYVWPESQFVRSNMTEDQPGVPLSLDVGVMDMATCEPLPDAMVSLWQANATGSYSSFTKLNPNLSFGQLLRSLNLTHVEYGVTDLHTDDTTWLRGMSPTNKEGMMQMDTIFPGFYAGRTIHIHSQVYTNYTLLPNGTISSGNLVNTGQMYFDEELIEQMMALQPYASHTQIERVTNAKDTHYAEGFENGWNPVISVIPMNEEDRTKGMIGYITLGIDTTDLNRPPNFIEPASPLPSSIA
ncbi:hypothetical protein B5807_10112 [Epicoccum nigrum]|uniref:Intradiol ring-cleavage dioxygenases domain-containing protein n=1 Tax=Epicoccum nigrum TaxID=105696 RepID=A0A1Y2LTM2_EPING|nr:hypothetical protein B5807_10112 [Epicoccum nigrum]